MERTRRCDLLARLPDKDLQALAALVIDAKKDQVVPVTPPTTGMIMARIREGARGDVFNLGEVLVTECQVRVGKREGWSMLMGNRPKGALAAASIDAVTAAGHPATSELDALLSVMIADQDALAAAERAKLATTRVQFDTQ
ncbi:MAG TPA: phosphonate C-P lyase system protein PhnG [Thermomicrobiales bacterium]|nr:phosphonate C-P lyase system protein PhnG [Thermomicrobiales bacterium]